MECNISIKSEICCDKCHVENAEEGQEEKVVPVPVTSCFRHCHCYFNVKICPLEEWSNRSDNPQRKKITRETSSFPINTLTRSLHSPDAINGDSSKRDTCQKILRDKKRW